MSLHDKHQKKAAECLHHSNYQAVTCLDTTTHGSSFIGEGLFKIQGFLQLKSLGRNQMSTFFSYHICFMIASFLICNTMFCPPTTHTVIHTTHSLLQKVSLSEPTRRISKDFAFIPSLHNPCEIHAIQVGYLSLQAQLQRKMSLTFPRVPGFLGTQLPISSNPTAVLFWVVQGCSITAS